MAQVGDDIFVQWWLLNDRYEAKAQHASLADAQAAILAKFPEVLKPHFFWNNDGRTCWLCLNVAFPYPLPFVRRVELT